MDYLKICCDVFARSQEFASDSNPVSEYASPYSEKQYVKWVCIHTIHKLVGKKVPGWPTTSTTLLTMGEESNQLTV